MKVVQINEVCERGSTGSICKEISEFCFEKDIFNIVYYGQKSSSYKNSRRFGCRIENLIHSLLFTRILGIHGYGSILNTLCLIKLLKKEKPDIIHLHNLHTNYINYPILYNYIIKSKTPIVMTLHDCYNFTGQCEHYVGVDCNKFITGCCNCPFIHRTIAASTFFDWSHLLWKRKKRWYEKINQMKIVAVSKWLESETAKSILACGNHKISCIYNWVNTDIFHPRPLDELNIVSSKYSLNLEKKYIIAVAAEWKKNTTKYSDIIRLNEILPTHYQLIVVGASAPSTIFPDSIIRINYTENAEELACLYTIAVAYVHVSVCDTFGKVIAEAMACGTSPIVYNSTACPETTGGYGVIVAPHNVEAIVSALNCLPSQRAEMINFVKTNYNKRKNISKYIELYKELVCR